MKLGNIQINTINIKEPLARLRLARVERTSKRHREGLRRHRQPIKLATLKRVTTSTLLGGLGRGRSTLRLATKAIIDGDIRNEPRGTFNATTDATVTTDPSSDLDQLLTIVTFVTLQTQV